MSWIQEENKLSWFEKFVINIIKCGPIPNHVAFIMDGNRRFATKSNMNKAEGHMKGFDKLSETLQWCLDVGVNEVTVYAFSIENFKRSKEEVDTLMRLAKEKFERLLEEREKLNERGICIRVIGNLKLLPKDIQKTISEAMLLTKNNNKAVLNIAFAYTSREEISNSVKTILEGVEQNELNVEDLNYALIDECLYTNKCSTPDLLVRTSGEVRFSDFLLWQTSTTILYFTKTLWPEFKLWHLLGAVFYYQRCYLKISVAKNHFQNQTPTFDGNEKVLKFLDKVESRRTAELVEMSRIQV